MKAAIYARFSTDRQNESSISDQLRICGEFAARQQMAVTETFEDHGISGAALGNRPAALETMEAALAGRFDVLLVTDLSRLSRSNGDLAKMIDRLVARRVRVIGVQDGYDSSRRGHRLQAGLSGIIGEAFREMVRDRTRSALESRAKQQKPTGGKCYGYDGHAVNAEQAGVVVTIFERFANGESCRAIAADLNAQQVPSPGSAWNRSTRRTRGWMGSAIRAMLRNERYTGTVHWNTSEWIKDPDTGKRKRRMNPRSQWITHHDESQRIVSDELFQRAQRTTRLGDDLRLKSGGKPKYLLSGLLECGVCGSHYIMSDPRSYACGGHVGGRVCGNSIRVRRDAVEARILGPVRDELLAPDRVQQMAREIARIFADRVQAEAGRAACAPQSLLELEARIARLRERLGRGDPDMTSDEIQAAIERAEEKRRELLSLGDRSVTPPKVAAVLPAAAALYRQQIAEGLTGNPQAALKARVILRALLGTIRLTPGENGSLWADYALQPAALLKSAVGAGTDGSGGRI